jgi:hypothetical protein
MWFRKSQSATFYHISSSSICVNLRPSVVQFSSLKARDPRAALPETKIPRGNGSWRRSPVAPHPHENGAAHSSFAGQSLNFSNQRIDFPGIVCLVAA